VDCLDALASDRQYRRAYPLDEAMAMVVAESGKSFDPAVVDLLKSRYVELEKKAKEARTPDVAKLSKAVVVERGAAPDAGFEEAGGAQPQLGSDEDFLMSIASARQEVQTLFEVTQQLGNSLSLPETLSMLALRLRPLIAYEALAVYILRDEKLVPEYVTGEDSELFSSLAIPIGEGLAGWVAQHRKAIVNGNPSVESSYLNDATKSSKLSSALAVPLEDASGVVGVLSLYRLDPNAFTRDQLRVLQAVASKVAVAVRNSLMYRQASVTASTDYLTGLPNARSLFLHLDAELSRSRRSQEPLTVLVCDLDGFKRVNDELGHLTGNRVLAEVAKALKGCSREHDYVARMGGDEFVIVLPGLDTGDILPTLRRIEQAVAEAGIGVCGQRTIGLSVGHAEFGADGQSVEDLLAEADRRMYVNKRKLKLVPRALAS
jgi:diguanylate cyclase (GGDEF)-like protein